MSSRLERVEMAADRLISAINSLTVVRKPLTIQPTYFDLWYQTLFQFADLLKDAQPVWARPQADEITRILLCCGARRVTGDIMLDFILHTVLITENAFSKAAASGRRDEALMLAMRRDLNALKVISELDEGTMYKLIAEAAAANPSPDSASKLAQAAWSGGGGSSLGREPNHAQRSRLAPPDSCWYYGEFELRDAYCADNELEGLYQRFLDEENWGELTEELWRFFSRNGSGDFLKYRHFYFDGELKPLPELRAGSFVGFAEAELDALRSNASAFLEGESAKPMLLCGRQGSGKTTLMLELMDELPSLHTVFVPNYIKSSEILALLEKLRNQPMKFMLFMDDLNPNSLNGLCEPMLPMNVLVSAASAVPVMQSFFEITVELPDMEMEEFIRAVMMLLEADGAYMPRETVRSACMDHRMETKCELNIASAVRVKELLQS